jgi:alkylhydroperoxidase/carboxymuconolactone decarboxylase family protein YurZ
MINVGRPVQLKRPTAPLPAVRRHPSRSSVLLAELAHHLSKKNRAEFGRSALNLCGLATSGSASLKDVIRDLWLRPDLAPRDRSLVTVSALIASGQVAQVPYHLNRAMDNGLTQPQAAEVIAHLAFYAGWPNAFSSLPVARDVFEKRPH